MTFFRRHWYDIGLVLALITLVVAAIVGFTGLRLILLLEFVALLLHQFEEYHLPGGEPWILNEVSQPKGGPTDRFPLNQNNALFMNVVLWPVYLLPVFLPHVPWLAIAPLVMGAIGQFVVHAVLTTMKLKAVYDPGLATVLFGFIPLAVWYFITAYNEGIMDWWQWLFGIVYGAAVIGISFRVIGYGILQDKNSPYPFAAEEMSRFDRERRLRHAGITPLPYPPTR